MIALPRTPAGRVALAIGLSLLVHAIVLFAPMVKLQPREVQLPPLIAKLEPLPKIAAKPKPVKKPQPKPSIPQPAPAEPEAAQPAPQLDAATQPEPAAEPPQVQPEPAPQTVVGTAEENRPAHPLPRHAQLTFVASLPSGLEVIEARHRLDVDNERSYTLKASATTTGLARLFKAYEMNQQSIGTMTAQGLRPEAYSATRNSAGSKETSETKFDWQAKLLTFSNGKETSLPEQTQDDISYLYQLSQLPLDKGMVAIDVVRNDKLVRYELTVGEEEEIQTRLGKLRVLPLHKVHAPGEEGLDIWLGLEYRLLPVKIRHFNRAGQIDGEMVISDIRVEDEN